MPWLRKVCEENADGSPARDFSDYVVKVRGQELDADEIQHIYEV